MYARFAVGLIVSVLLAIVVACTPAAQPPAPTAAKPAAPAPAPTKPAALTPVAAKTTPPTPTSANAASASPAPKAAPADVTVGNMQLVSDAGTYVALEKGYFKDEGLNVKLENFRTTMDMVPPLSTGQIDVAMIPMGAAVLQAADRGVEIKLVADKGTTQPKFEFVWILLRKDLADSGKVKTPADLKGMKVAIPSVASLGEQTVQEMIEGAGLTTNDVQVEVVPFADHPAAFTNKAIAASYTVEPLITRVVAGQFAVKWIPNSKFFNDKLSSATIYYGANFLKNKDLGQRFMVAYIKGARDYMKAFTTGEGKGDVVKALIKHTSAKDPKLYDVMEMPYIDPNGQVDRNSLEVQYKWFVSKGLYKGNRTFNDLYDPSFAENAMQKLGKFPAR